MSKQVIVKMIDWIENNLTENVSLTEMSKYIGYSPYYCSVKFHEMTGSTIKSYIANRKIYLAAIKLRETNLRILDIALAYGFSSQEAFTRAFSSVYSCTPLQYRKNHSLQLDINSVFIETHPNQIPKITLGGIG